jgi:WD40 repeat protein
MALAAGARLGPYEVVDLVGAGGMGEVYRARDPRLSRDVAIKVLPAAVAASPERQQRFEREARAVAAVSHPNVLTVFDVGTQAVAAADGSAAAIPFVVTELLQGETLRELMRHRPPTQQQVLSFAAQIARGLDAAHGHGVVHRDVKPENVFVTSDGRVKVLDFGIAKLSQQVASEGAGATESAPTGDGQVPGTIGYMSPEQLRGQSVDHRTDIFSLGVVLYELLGGKHPFHRDSAVATVTAILEETPPELSTLTRGVPPAVSGVVRRCLEKDREQRFRSAHDLALSLEATLGGRVAASAPQDVEERSPYPGLASFTETDAAVFFGREAEVKALWKRLQGRKLAAVIGPSGAGKTSFVRAGVVASRPAGWGCLVCTPGRSAFRGLGRALVPGLSGDPEATGALVDVDDPAVACELVGRWRRRHDEALLVVDQFEELFTLNPAQTQASFADLLSRLASEADVHVLVSLRDDFLMKCAEHAGLAPLFESLTPLPALARSGLRRALVEPAETRGFALEDEALVDEMLTASEGARAPLPLLAFAVSRLWEQRDGERKLLTRAAHEAIGGVAGALAQHAEAAMEQIGPERQAIVRELFRNLVTAQGTRAVAERGELLSAFSDERPAAEEVLRQLIDARLLTSYELESADGQPGQHRVEVAHESLLTAWPRLVRWQAQDEEGAVLRDQLRQAAHLWDEKGRTGDLLWTGTAFREFELWRERYPGALTAVEEAFARAMSEKARRRKRLVTAAVSFVILALAGVAIVVDASRHEAVAARSRGEAARLVALGRVELDRYPTAAVAYARRSLEVADTIEARQLALEALWRGPVTSRLTVDEDCSRVAFSADGQRIACSGFTQRLSWVSRDGAVHPFTLQPTKADARSTLPLPTGLLTWLPGDDRVRELSPEGREVRSYKGEVHHLRVLPDVGFVTCGPAGPGARDLVIRVWRQGASEPAELGRWSPPPGMRFDQPGLRPLDIDPRLHFLAYGWEDGVYVRSLRPAAPADVLVDRHDGQVREVAFDAAGERLASIDDRGQVKIRAVPAWKDVRSVAAVPAARFSLLAFDARGERLAWGAAGEGVLLWDTPGPPDAALLTLRRGEVVNESQQAFSPDGRWLVSGGFGESIDFWPLDLPHALVLRGHAEGPIERLAFSGDSRALVSCARDGARVWPLTSAGGRQRLIPVGGEYMCYDIGVEPAGHDVVVASPFKGIYVVPIQGGAARQIVDLAGRRLALSGIAFDDATHRVAVGSTYAPGPEELSLFVIDLVTGARKELRERAGPSDDPYSGHVDDMAFAPDGSLLTAGDDGVKRWNIEKGTSTILYGGPGHFAGLAVSRDRRRAVALVGSKPGSYFPLLQAEIVLLDLETGSHRALPLHGARLTHAVALDPAGERLVTGDVTGAVRVGRISGEEPHLLLGHSGPVTDVAVSPDGKWIASASGAEIRLWPMPDVSKPPLHTLPHDELMARLGSLTNLRVVEDAASTTGYRLDIGPFPGWKDVPTW